MNAFTCWWKNIKLQNKAIKVSEKKKKYVHRWMMILDYAILREKNGFIFHIMKTFVLYMQIVKVLAFNYHHTTFSKQYSQFMQNDACSYLITTLWQKHMQG